MKTTWLYGLSALALAMPAWAVNPFSEPTKTDETARRSAPSATTPADPGRMPPGTPAQWSGAVMPMAESPISQAQQVQQRWLDRLAVSSVVGRKILFRVQGSSNLGNDGYASSYGNNGGYSPSGATVTAGSVSSLSVPTSGSSGINTTVVLRAQESKPFLLGQEQYVAVVEGFTVVLYRATDRELRNPVWAGEPTPVRHLVLPPNTTEFVNNSSTVSTNPPATVMPSAAFGAGGATTIGVNSGTTSGTSTNSNNNGNTVR